SEFLRRFCQFDRLQQGVGGGAGVRSGRGRPMAERQKSDLLHAVVNLLGRERFHAGALRRALPDPSGVAPYLSGSAGAPPDRELPPSLPLRGTNPARAGQTSGRAWARRRRWASATATAVRLTTSVTSASRWRTWTDLARPDRMGPITSAPASRLRSW